MNSGSRHRRLVGRASGRSPQPGLKNSCCVVVLLLRERHQTNPIGGQVRLVVHYAAPQHRLPSSEPRGNHPIRKLINPTEMVCVMTCREWTNRCIGTALSVPCPCWFRPSESAAAAQAFGWTQGPHDETAPRACRKPRPGRWGRGWTGWRRRKPQPSPAPARP